MRILFDQAVYDLRNKGNMAILQVPVNRISKFWPEASLEVITSAPYLLRLFCPNATPVSFTGEYDWSKSHNPLHDLFRRMPIPILRVLLELREQMWQRKPGLAAGLTYSKIKSPIRSGENPQEVQLDINEGIDRGQNQFTSTEMIHGVDLFVATGGQYMADVCKNQALQVLDRLEGAIRLGISTAMVGQGVGPIEDSKLTARARAVLPLVDSIFVREKLVAPELLRSFGVDPARVYLTGDDAIELAYEARTSVWGEAIGVGLRVADYTEVNDYHIEQIQQVLSQAAAKYRAPLIPLSISESAHELDGRAIQRVLNGSRYATSNRWRLGTPLAAVKKTGRCRIVIAGTYHTAVFALAQGVPAVGLVKSKHYMNKFYGLADMFGVGCAIVLLDDKHFGEKLADAIDKTWSSAEQIRPQLLERAKRQIEMGHAAYERLRELVESKNREMHLLWE